jgi:heme/copper-type cytochrome/quinol oxidase subunit 1
MELSGPGVQYIADNQLYNSIVTAHALLMIFFMVEKYFILKSQPITFFSEKKNGKQ